MAEFIVNPRRAPRAPARCRAAVVSPAGPFEAETENIGTHGCQVVSPHAVRPGDRVELSVSNEKLPAPLRVAGTVAWVSTQAPWRVGIAFDEHAYPACQRWLEQLVAAHPWLGAGRRVPERIPLDATVYLGPPPRFLVDFTAAEARVLRAVGSGVRVDELQARLRSDWPAAQVALFSLLARQAVTLARGQAAHPEAWKKVLIEVEASLAVESLDSAPGSLAAPPPTPDAPASAAAPVGTPAPPRPARTPPPLVPAASPWGTPPRSPHPLVDLGREGPSLETAGTAPPPVGGPARGAGRGGDVWGAERRGVLPDHVGAGVGWRAGVPRTRTAEAQEAFERSRAELAVGDVNGAIALLRRALALSPGDPEIADALGKLAFKDRDPGAR